MMAKISGVVAMALTALALLTGASTADAQSRTIRVGNWLPMHHLNVSGIIEPWARAIERETNGELKFEIMSSALAGPPQYFDLVLDGAVDVGFGVSGHNPGRFPMTQVMELPFMSPDPAAGSAAAWLTYERYGARYGEHKGAKVVGLWVHSEPYIFMRSEKVSSLADLAGKKIRIGGNVTGRIVSMLGATPVQLPPTEAQQAMTRGIADGITFPAESLVFFNIHPVIKSAIRFPGGLYTDTFWLAFNQGVWDQLTPSQKAAVEKHSGLAIAIRAGLAWSAGDRWAFNALQGLQTYTLSAEETAKAKETLKVMEQEWLAEAQKRSLPGPEILDYARVMAQSYRNERRVNIPGLKEP
ncbi:TRAP transporter substrate-binding protein [Arenibaculum pallidiluteum]|uniref:TRAP transporter substrate-binding protein n=1 Tax=Arenibaculum pallidiluteum TaxID=2812559 RepID=UPI001A96C3E0|nr:TRAP transporter substrate-binding protein [Arenibaculum pallidiluteum]